MSIYQPQKSPWQTGKVDVGGLRIHYTRTGGDKPSLVLSHGITDDSLCWAPVAQVFEDEYDVVMVDARGHGFSGGCDTGYGPIEQAADLAGAIAGLHLHKPVLWGHSMGAATTLLLAGLHPDAPAAIILEDPPPWWASQRTEEQEKAHHEGFMNWLSGLKSKTRQELITEEHARSPKWSEAELGLWADSKLRFKLEVLSLLTSNPAADAEWQKLLTQVKCPGLLITADNALGAIITQADALALQALIPQFNIVHITGAGHNIRREQFEAYISAARAFLAGLNK